MIESEKKVGEDLKNQEIETITWDILQRKIGLRIRRNLTSEEKKQIINSPDFIFCKDEALRIYNQRQLKKEKSVHNKKYPVIQVPPSGKPDWYEGARTLCFVYSKHHGNFILEGYRGEVEEYLKKNYTHYFCYVSMWSHGESRGLWHFWKKEVHIFAPSRAFKERKFRLVKYEKNENKRIYEKLFKRLPKHWISEFDNL